MWSAPKYIVARLRLRSYTSAMDNLESLPHALKPPAVVYIQILRSTNGGVSWEVQRFQDGIIAAAVDAPGMVFNDVQAIGPQEVIAVGTRYSPA